MVRFPWTVFIRFFLAQVLGFVALFVVSLLVFFNSAGIESSEFWRPFCIFAGGAILVATFTSWRFTLPIRRALQKALRVSSKKYARISGDRGAAELLEDEPGEYSELVSALDRIDRKLKKRKDQLFREREENAAFMSSVAEGLISVSPEGRLLYFNSQFAALFLSPEVMRSEEGVRLTDAIRVPEIFESFRQVLRTGLSQKAQVRLSTRIDHQARDFAVSMTPLRKENTGEIRGVIGILHDVTDLKKAERIRIEFVGNASHELRTPLTSIKGYLDTLRDDFEAGRMDQAGTFLATISRNVDRLIELVNDLLSLSALDHHPELKLETVNALVLSDHVVKELSRMASDKNQVIHVSGHVEPFVADAAKVEQVLRNLVSNAIKYIPEAQQIQIRWEEGDNRQTILRVIDHGPGIPKEHHQRLFERFYRIDKGRSRDAGGTGLGLAIVKHIMQSHGGGVSVISEPGKGSEFVCVFPWLKEAGFKDS